MADNTGYTPGTGITVATDERTINSASVHIQRVGEIGASAFATSQVSVTNSATSLLSARETRKRVILSNRGAVDAYVGASGVATNTGFQVAAYSAITLYVTGQVYGITASSSTTFDVLEEYDA